MTFDLEQFWASQPVREPVLGDDGFLYPRLVMNVNGVDIYAVYKNEWCQDREMNYHFSTARYPETLHREMRFDVRAFDYRLDEVLLDQCVVGGKYLDYLKWLDVIRPVIESAISAGDLSIPAGE